VLGFSQWVLIFISLGYLDSLVSAGIIRRRLSPVQLGDVGLQPVRMLRQFYLMGEEVKRSMEWLMKRLIKVGAKVAYHGRRWYVHAASAFPLARHYRAVFA
jgi:hypothetical protein